MSLTSALRSWREEMPARIAMSLPPWDDAKAWGDVRREAKKGSQAEKEGGGGDEEVGMLKATGSFEAVVKDVKRVE